MAVILCIDDSDVGLFVRKLLLEKYGHSVLTATCSAEGLALFKSEHVDLVISDHCLHGETGAEIAPQMKQLKPAVPFILLSGSIDPPDCMAHIDLFMTKAIDPHLFIQTITSMLSTGTRQAATN